MYLVTVIEKYNGKIYKTTYGFKDVNQMRQFKKMCEDANCIVIVHKNQNNITA